MRAALEPRWVTVHGSRMFARVGTEAPAEPRHPAVVLVHGQVISSLYMVPTARLLAPRLRVLAPDLPGFGRSARPARTLSVPELADRLAAWMDAIGLPRAVLAANSLGCQVAVDLAVRRPDLAAGLVLSGPTMDPAARSATAQILRWLRDWPHERPSLALAHLRDFALAGPVRTLRTFRFALADRIETKLPRVRAPALVVRGERDPIAPQDWAEQAARLLPRGRLAVIPGGPHCVNYSTPRAFASLVEAFVREVEEDVSS